MVLDLMASADADTSLSLAHPVMIGLAVVVLFLITKAVQAVASPYADCVRCHGSGHPVTASRRRAARACRRCKGHGKRLRVGRRMWNAALRAREESQP